MASHDRVAPDHSRDNGEKTGNEQITIIKSSFCLQDEDAMEAVHIVHTIWE